MKLLNYINQTQAKSSDLLAKSYKENFCKNVTDEELKSLEDHQVLYKKVLDELGGRVNGAEEMSTRFNNHIENNFNELLSVSKFYVKPDQANVTDLNVSLLNPKTWSKPLWTYQDNHPVIDTPKTDLSPIIKKFGESQDGNIYENISIGLTNKGQTHIDPEVLEHYLAGIRNTDLMTWERFSESVFYTADFIQSTLNVSEMAVLLEYCITNEKFIFLLLYPYFFKPLKKLLWSYLYPVFSLTADSFTFFLKQVALQIGNIIKHKNAVVHGFYNLKISRSVKLTLGTGCFSSLLLLYSNHFIKDNKALVPLYSGMSGLIGQSANIFRLEASKFVFEITKTVSTLGNAAIAGFLEPKQEAVKQIIRSLFKK